ncbi:retrovirus-related Pol polyprotein from transposon opus [Trichonephila clavipes]|nr:retrovirus-related Pol polyprotein from transposon opus [Trichonephila clavipes]
MALYRSPLTVTLWPSSFLKKYGPMIPPAHKEHQTRFINEALFGLEFVFPYLDDILVASENEEQHKSHLKLVFDRLQKHGLRVNISKSTLGVTHLELLGYLITPERSKPLPKKVDAILSYKLPEIICDL